MRVMLLASVAAVMTMSLAIAQPAPSPAFQRAILEGLSPETRAEVEGRATGGNSVYEVARVILLNNMQLAGLIQPGEALPDVVAIDFIRENAVFRADDRVRIMQFDAKTLRFKQ